MEKPEIGTVVTLKAGGPRMTVVKIEESGNVETVWFDKSQFLNRGNFPPEALNTGSE
jgi:uncharacterized protein YodC (DUF2158 family)